MRKKERTCERVKRERKRMSRNEKKELLVREERGVNYDLNNNLENIMIS